jgi:pilus assembly protein CpaE
MTIYLLTSEPSEKNDQIGAIEAKLITLVPELRKIEKFESVAGEIREKKSDAKLTVIFVSPTLPGSSLDNLITIASRFRERVFFVLVSNELSGADYKRLVRSGGADWVAATGSLQEIPELLYRQDARSASATQTEIRPTILSFLPCMGGVGNTTIALDVSLRIKLAKTSRSWKVCYVDFDFQTSHVCDYLDIEARFQISEILDRPERLDAHLFELFVSHHASGLDVIAAPRSKLDPSEIDAAVLDPLLEMVSEKYDYIVFDLPVAWFGWTVPILENSNAIMMTGINTIPCLRQMRATLDEVVKMKVSSSQVALVMNRTKQRLLRGIDRRHHVESVFPNETIFYVREYADAVDKVNTGTPAALDGSHAKELAKLMSFCTALRQARRRQAAK